MKKRTRTIIGFTLLAIVLIVLHFFYGLFTPYNYLTAKWDIARNKPRILQYGEPMRTDKQAFQTATRFGFTYDIVAGCAVTPPLVNGIDAYNAAMTTHLNKQLGKDWKNRFDFEVDSLFREDRVDTIQKTILAIEDIKQLDNYLDSISNGKRHLYIWVLPQEKSKPNVRVSEKYPDGSIRVFEYYQVNPYTLEALSVKY